MSEALDRYCIVGAGPSGLAAAAALKAQGVPFDQFERHGALGGLWDIDNPGSPVYESAHFISSRTMSELSGFAMPQSYPDYPRRDQILAYLQSFARHHGLEAGIRFNTEVERVVPSDGRAEVRVAGESRHYRGVICCSGMNWDPITPEYPGDFDGELRHAASYRNPDELRDKRVLVVGLGNSGADIACDAVRSARSVEVSIRRGYHFVPKHIFGTPADVFAHDGPSLPLWLETPIFGFLVRLLTGDPRRVGMPKPDHKILQTHPLMNDQLLHHLRHGDVGLVGDIQSLSGSTVNLKGGRTTEADVILFATGYGRKVSYLAAEHLDDGEHAASHFLTCFSRKYDSLFTLGYAELNGALFPHVGRLAALLGMAARHSLDNDPSHQRFRKHVQTAQVDLTGGRELLPTLRHAHYCDEHALEKATRRTFRTMGWTCP